MNGAAGPSETSRRYAASATDPGDTGASASGVPGYVQSTVAQFSPPRTPQWSPKLPRVQVNKLLKNYNVHVTYCIPVIITCTLNCCFNYVLDVFTTAVAKTV